MTELLSAVLAAAILLSLLVPAVARSKSNSYVQVSMQNLAALHQAFTSYGADWNDRQPTAIVDNFSTYGPSIAAAFAGYQSQHGEHPWLWVGEHCPGGPLYAFSTGPVYVPIDLWALTATGFFRFPNVKMIHDYLDGRFYSRSLYAPADRATFSLIEPWFDNPCEFHPSGNVSALIIRSSYAMSPAAMYEPSVFRRNSQGGYRDPLSFPTGFKSPTFSQAKYTNLKTQILEHHWNQNAPADICNPVMFNQHMGCEPYYFNHGFASAPATLFYDGQIRLLPNAEVIASDAQLIQQNGEGLWHRGTPFGVTGYFGNVAQQGVTVSHHILTIDGIRGRDTLPGLDH